VYPLSPNKSDFLNFVRWVAALVVVIGHADMYLGLFGGGDPAQWSAFGYLGVHAHAAVIVFFVLSGYVVAYATDRKSNLGNYGFRGYFLDRWSRIYSVLLAAVGFTLALDYVGGMLSPAYDNPAFIPQDGFVFRLVANLISIQGIWGYRIQLGSNPALWSVGYEFIYYLLFGVLYFRAQIFRRSWVGVLVVVLVLGLIGWKMAAYFGIWLTGVAAYHASHSRMVKQHPISAWLVIAMLVAANHLLVYSNILGAIEVLRDFVFAVVIAVLLSLEVKQMAPFYLRGRQINTYMADFSYSIYAFHTPIVFFGCSLLFEPWLRTLPSLFSGLMLVTVSILVARGFFHLAESRRTTYRRIVDQLMRRLGI
jgi:peptidoglycan/LPS O-acetylase OafA/YrhL